MASPSLSDLPAPAAGQTGWPWTEASRPVSERMSESSSWPSISIVTPSYNQGAFIEETIRSVLLQDYPNLEYIVIDGGSTDETVDIIQKYEPWLDAWVSENDEGQSDAINKGFNKATGDIFAWLNSDDYYLPNALERVGAAFTEMSSEVGAVVGRGHKVDLEGEVVYTPFPSGPTFETLLNWMNGENFMQPACFFRRQAWDRCGPLRTELQYPMDVDLWLSIAKEFTFQQLDADLAHAYQHERAKTTAERERMRAETDLVIAEYGGFEIARRDLMEMADDLVETRRKLLTITTHPLYQYVIGPIYRWLRTRSSPSGGHDPEE